MIPFILEEMPVKNQKQLTQKERDEVLAVLSVGCSRAAAARCILRDPTFLYCEIAKDPEFAAQVVKAESGMEVSCLSRIRQAASEKQYWKANAWLLERRMPDRYAAKKPGTFTAEHIQQFMTTCMQIIVETVPNEKQREEILNRLAEELQES
ncbi:MAG: hypothetical protein LBI05_05095 [Planctomycetaceae bacterium]|nr:hypothetical protein [Planctomycetaceae bacterium]